MCYKSLDPKPTEAIPTSHVFTGCDQTGLFCGKFKSCWWNNFMKTDNHVLNIFTNLGIGEYLPTMEPWKALKHSLLSYMVP